MLAFLAWRFYSLIEKSRHLATLRVSKNGKNSNNGKEESYERNPGRANRGMSLTGQATTGRMEKTCEIVEKLSTVQSNSGRIYSILGSLQYCHQYGPAKKFGT